MPVKADSRFAKLKVVDTVAPDGSPRRVIALPLGPRQIGPIVARHRVSAGEQIDLLAHRFYGDERLYDRLLDANPLVYPLDLVPGDVLDVPGAGPVTRATRARKF